MVQTMQGKNEPDLKEQRNALFHSFELMKKNRDVMFDENGNFLPAYARYTTAWENRLQSMCGQAGEYIEGNIVLMYQEKGKKADEGDIIGRIMQFRRSLNNAVFAFDMDALDSELYRMKKFIF